MEILTDRYYLKYLAAKKGDTTLMAIAPHMGLKIQALNERLHGRIEFRASEILKFKEYYEVSSEDLCKCFFSNGVKE